jgi:hypothetical protein
MKRFWLVLLSLGLITVFSTSALAVDVKFSGEFYVAGVYLDKVGLTRNPGSADRGNSTAFYAQRLRVRTYFIVSPGLSLVTRFDALERAWGEQRSTPTTTLAIDSYGTLAENENIAIDWAYINYDSPIGTFAVGIMNDGATGTVFGDSYNPNGRIKYSLTLAPVTLNLAYTKVKATNVLPATTLTAYSAAGVSDGDQDKYGIEGIFTWKSGKAGLNVNYYRYADTKPTSNYVKWYYVFTPYAIAKIGPVDLQAEFNYAYGKAKVYDSGATANVDLENYSGWVDATVTLGPVYFGGFIAYVSGQDPNDPNATTKQTGGTLNGGRDWSPTLIMYNWDRNYWVGTITSNSVGTTNGFGSSFANGWMYQGRVGVKPLAQLDIMAALTYATVDKRPLNYVGGNYGTEFDIIAKYNITSNLSYMLGVGYLWTGDYFRGTSSDNGIVDDYIITNKLMLTF